MFCKGQGNLIWALSKKMAPKCDIENEKSTSLYAFNFHVMLLHTYQCFLNSRDFGEKKEPNFFL